MLRKLKNKSNLNFSSLMFPRSVPKLVRMLPSFFKELLRKFHLLMWGPRMINLNFSLLTVGSSAAKTWCVSFMLWVAPWKKGLPLSHVILENHIKFLMWESCNQSSPQNLSLLLDRLDMFSAIWRWLIKPELEILSIESKKKWIRNQVSKHPNLWCLQEYIR